MLILTKSFFSVCAFWAAIGECEANPGYMKLKCAPSCQTCDMIDINKRCPPLPDDVVPGLLPGDLNAMFERIVATAPGNNTDIEMAPGMTNYSVVIHSRPAPVEGEAVIDPKLDLEQPPWIITFNNFLTDEECEQMIILGHKSEYERSKDVGELQTDGSYDSVVSTSRTSENAWCSYQKKCRSEEVPQLIHERIAMVTGIKANHSEDFQILKYEPGQFYR
jgi:prolyl 4-hydroxylase